MGCLVPLCNDSNFGLNLLQSGTSTGICTLTSEVSVLELEDI